MEPLPCEPPPGLLQTKASGAAKVGRQVPRERTLQNRNTNSSNSAWKDRPRAPNAGIENSEPVGDDASRRIFQPYHSMSVPKKRDLEVSYGGSNATTTVMLRNIPNKYTQGSLLQEIDSMGFIGTYNFFYLPMDIHNRTNVGYAFINFMSPGDMQAFIDLFTDYKFKRHQSQKIARVSTAHIQGFLENVCHFSSCAVTRSRNSQYRPIVAYHGQLRDLAEILLELSSSRHTAAGSIIAPEVLASLESGVYASRVTSGGASIYAGLNPSAAEFVPAACPQKAAWTAGAGFALDPGAEEFVPRANAAASALGTSVADPTVPEKSTFQTTLPDDKSFIKAKKGLEEAVSMWLAGARTGDTQSTEGGDSGGSSHGSPRSASDKEATATSPAEGKREV